MGKQTELLETTIKVIDLKRKMDLANLESDSLMEEASTLMMISAIAPLREQEKISKRLKEVRDRMEELSKLMKSLREEVDSISNGIKIDALLGENGICKN